jgi:hypothetical protein
LIHLGFFVFRDFCPLCSPAEAGHSAHENGESAAFRVFGFPVQREQGLHKIHIRMPLRLRRLIFQWMKSSPASPDIGATDKRLHAKNRGTWGTPVNPGKSWVKFALHCYGKGTLGGVSVLLPIWHWVVKVAEGKNLRIH